MFGQVVTTRDENKCSWAMWDKCLEMCEEASRMI